MPKIRCHQNLEQRHHGVTVQKPMRALRTFICLTLATAGCFSHITVAAQPHRCHTIKDADKRAYCLAQTQSESFRCHAIRNSDLRNQCLAVLSGQPFRCHNIRDRDARQSCLATTGK
jgi:hypothetical protein